jgi:hypothetical protein
MTDRIQIIQPAQGMTEYWRRVDADPLMVVMVERIVIAGRPRGSGALQVKVSGFSTIALALEHANADETGAAFVIYTLRIDDPEWGERMCDG